MYILIISETDNNFNETSCARNAEKLNTEIKNWNVTINLYIFQLFKVNINVEVSIINI